MEDDRRQPPSREDQGRERSGLGGLWLLLAPLACCGGPLLIGVLASAGALAWGGLGLGLALAAAVAVILVMRRRRSRARCLPDAAGSARAAAEGFRAR